MAEQWVVDSERYGAEVFADYRHFIRRYRELCEQEAKISLQVRLPASASSLQRMVVKDMGFVMPPVWTRLPD